MAAPYSASDVDYVLARCQTAALYIKAAGDRTNDAAISTTWAGARTYFFQVAGALQAAANFIYDDGGSSLGDLLHNILEAIRANWPEGGTVTMSAILSAMLAAQYDELQQFIGLEDAYRSALWDQPFNAEFYAALARGFRP